MPRLGRLGNSMGLCSLGEQRGEKPGGLPLLQSTLLEGTRCMGDGGGDAISHNHSLGHKRKCPQECLGDQPPVVLYWFYLLITLPAGSRPEEANEVLAGLWGSDHDYIKEILTFGKNRSSEMLGGSLLPRSKVRLKIGQVQEGSIVGNAIRTFLIELCLLVQPHFHSSPIPTPYPTHAFSSRNSEALVSVSLHSSHIF